MKPMSQILETLCGTNVEPKDIESIGFTFSREIPKILEIEQESFENPWSAEDFQDNLATKNILSKTYREDGIVKGFMIYEWFPKIKIKILKLAVAPEYRGNGIGTKLVEKIKEKANQGNLKVTLDSTYLIVKASGFFESQGFGISVNPDYVDPKTIFLKTEEFLAEYRR